MFIAIDIGNTKIAFGFFRGNKLIRQLDMPSTDLKELTDSRIIKQCQAPLRRSEKVTGCLISSVVPNATKIVKETLEKKFCVKAGLLGTNVKVPIKNLYHKPSQVGQDRLVNAYACLRYYGAPAIIIDFGTATTFDYIDKKRAYAGGLITPGVRITLDALVEKTALLPRVELKKPKRLIGRDTVDSIRAGVLFGLASMCDGIVEKIWKRYTNKARVIATGGLALFFSPYCKHIEAVDKNLTLKGLNCIYNEINKL